MRYFLAGAVCALPAGVGFSQPPGGVPITDEPPGGSRPAQPPPLSPPAKTSVTINGQKITINYSAPSMRKRVIFGGLVPYDQVWRAGCPPRPGPGAKALQRTYHLNQEYKGRNGAVETVSKPDGLGAALIVSSQSNQHHCCGGDFTEVIT